MAGREEARPEKETVPKPKPALPRKGPEASFEVHTLPDGTLDWQQPPPKKGRTPPPRPEEVTKAMQIRRAIEESRRRRGIPPEGIQYAGETPDKPKQKEHP